MRRWLVIVACAIALAGCAVNSPANGNREECLAVTRLASGDLHLSNVCSKKITVIGSISREIHIEPGQSVTVVPQLIND